MLEEFDHVVVVDWSCPQESGKWAASQGAEVVYRKGHKHFRISEARNAGALHVKTRSLCFIDADVYVMVGVKAEIESLLDLRHMVVASRTSQNTDIQGLNGFIALDIGQFWGVGGYDETLKGYALEDGHLRARLALERGMGVKRLSPGALASMRHSDELRGKFYEEPVEISSKRNYNSLMNYLSSRGVQDWTTDPRTSDIAYRHQ
jgi:predicted glycosyltransferase involved in capsule biosynthesis